MTDVKADIKAAILEILGELVQPKATAGGATGFGPLPIGAADKVYIQGGKGQASAWYRLIGEKNTRQYVEEEAYSGYVLSVNTRDQTGETQSRKIDLVMKDEEGAVTTFVMGLSSDLQKSFITVGAKSLLSALATCRSSGDLITIAPRLGDKWESVVLLSVLVGGVPDQSGKVDDEQVGAMLRTVQEMFGGTHILLKGEEEEPREQQPQPQRVAPPAAPAKAVAPTAKKERVARATDQQWTDLKTYLGDDPETVENTKELIVAWCKDVYSLKSPVSIPVNDQAAALYECKQHLDQWANPLQSQAPVPDEDWTDDVPF